MSKPSEQIIKEYPPKGAYKQFRFDVQCSLTCSKCGKAKKSRLITIIDDDWDRKLCNACYGTLLSSVK
jgi:hypothetical protein